METKFLNSLGRGATFKEISKQIVESINVKVPPIQMQEQFADFVKQIDKSKVVVPSKIKNAIFAIMLSVSFGQITSI
jgi:type I restriction enzyme S subunit